MNTETNKYNWSDVIAPLNPANLADRFNGDKRSIVAAAAFGVALAAVLLPYGTIRSGVVELGVSGIESGRGSPVLLWTVLGALAIVVRWFKSAAAFSAMTTLMWMRGLYEVMDSNELLEGVEASPGPAIFVGVAAGLTAIVTCSKLALDAHAQAALDAHHKATLDARAETFAPPATPRGV